MCRIMRFLTFAFTSSLCDSTLPALRRNIDEFFRVSMTDRMRHDPNSATSSCYSTGEEQDRFERQVDAYIRSAGGKA